MSSLSLTIIFIMHFFLSISDGSIQFDRFEKDDYMHLR